MVAAVSRDYSSLLKTVSRKQWGEIGTQRRAGVAVPLFSLHSKNSVGIGDFLDLKSAVDWCKLTGNSILQLLPLNCMGNNNAPYSAQSSFALDASYISLNDVIGVDITKFQKDILRLRTQFSIVAGSDGASRVDFGVKKEKLDLLYNMFRNRIVNDETERSFRKFKEKTAKYWLDDYVMYRVLKEVNHEKSWTDWDVQYKNRDTDALETFSTAFSEKLEFHRWVQWQLFEQLKAAKDYATSKGVNLMGDMPFLTSKDSADVWSKKHYFNLDRGAGAPADMYSKDGQRWGMPTHNWQAIKADNDYEFIRQKRQYAQNFYHIDRNDHVFGMFRIWTIMNNEPPETKGLNGVFVPPGSFRDNETLWEAQGRELLTLMIESSDMLHSAEDLGSPPKCCTLVLRELGIPGIDVDRWTPANENFREVATSTTSTHDSSFIPACLSRSEEPKYSKRLAHDLQIDDSLIREASPETVRMALARAANQSSIFFIPPIFDVLATNRDGNELARNHVLNQPGIVDDKFWKLRVHLSLEQMQALEDNERIRLINQNSGRFVD